MLHNNGGAHHSRWTVSPPWQHYSRTVGISTQPQENAAAAAPHLSGRSSGSAAALVQLTQAARLRPYEAQAVHGPRFRRSSRAARVARGAGSGLGVLLIVITVEKPAALHGGHEGYGGFARRAHVFHHVQLSRERVVDRTGTNARPRCPQAGHRRQPPHPHQPQSAARCIPHLVGRLGQQAGRLSRIRPRQRHHQAGREGPPESSQRTPTRSLRE